VTDKATQTDEIKKFTVPSVVINDSTGHGNNSYLPLYIIVYVYNFQ